MVSVLIKRESWSEYLIETWKSQEIASKSQQLKGRKEREPGLASPAHFSFYFPESEVKTFLRSQPAPRQFATALRGTEYPGDFFCLPSFYRWSGNLTKESPCLDGLSLY